jgi:hypothetical protein
MNKKLLLAIFVSLSAIFHSLYFAQPSHAVTWEEFTQTVEEVGKASGVWQRFMQDLEHTRRGSSPRTAPPTRRQIEPETQPQQPAGDDWNQETEEFQDN